MSKPQQNRQTKKSGSDASKMHDPLIVELVKLLARAAAERDYARISRGNADGKAAKRLGE